MTWTQTHLRTNSLLLVKVGHLTWKNEGSSRSSYSPRSHTLLGLSTIFQRPRLSYDWSEPNTLLSLLLSSEANPKVQYRHVLQTIHHPSRGNGWVHLLLGTYLAQDFFSVASAGSYTSSGITRIFLLRHQQHALPIQKAKENSETDAHRVFSWLSSTAPSDHREEDEDVTFPPYEDAD